jgi:hypothetical protein
MVSRRASHSSVPVHSPLPQRPPVLVPGLPSRLLSILLPLPLQ